GDDNPTLTKKAAAFHARTREQQEKVLTEAQRKKVPDLLGAPFAGRLGGGGFPGPGPGPVAVRFGVLEMQFLGAPEMRDELKLSAEQMDKLADLRGRYLTEQRELRRDGPGDE